MVASVQGSAPDLSSLPPLDRLLRIMATLRSPDGGCPWDREQTFATIAPYTIEEAYEVAEAIAEGDMSALRDELGDLLLQVVFHARMAEEEGLFDFEDVAATIADKMIRRHPNVFAGRAVADAAAQTRAWEAIKAAERTAKAAKAGSVPSALDGVGVALPALTRAVKLQARAARVGFDWTTVPPIFDKLDEEVAELKAELAEPTPDPTRIAEEMGDVLFVIANLARRLGVDPEAALRAGNAKFERRFRMMESLAEAGLDGLDLDAQEALWQRAKALETEG
ncbi:MAG: nucleoside triphosphate pyrophosphohydrolase [Alphaproteobacteria bacterium]|nr:nucleoside triphosphate pyrophosphohydrolase [Alphaproteobacteria bacterium]